MAAAMAITPLRDSTSQTKPMRRMFVSRSSLLKPRPFERFSRTTSPSSTSTLAPALRRRCAIMPEMVLLPAPESPVNHSVKPWCVTGCSRNVAATTGSAHPSRAPGLEDFVHQHVECALAFSIRSEMDAALFIGILLPPPAAGAFVFIRLHRARAWRAANAFVPGGIERMHGHMICAYVFVHLFG